MHETLASKPLAILSVLGIPKPEVNICGGGSAYIRSTLSAGGQISCGLKKSLHMRVAANGMIAIQLQRERRVCIHVCVSHTRGSGKKNT